VFKLLDVNFDEEEEEVDDKKQKEKNQGGKLRFFGDN